MGVAEIQGAAVPVEAGKTTMKTRHFINQIEKNRLVKAIQDAEQGSSGDIVLYISYKKVADPQVAAHSVFRKLSLGKTEIQNAVLIFLAPESQKLAVIGGTELYQKLTADWWKNLVAEMSTNFAQSRLTEGLLLAIEQIGIALKTHFPAHQEIDRSGQSDVVEET